MKTEDVSVRIVKKWPRKEIIRLYKAGGWWNGSDAPSLVDKMISGSFAFAVAVDIPSGKAVGMGRVLSDGASDAYIQDVVVAPERRKREIGGRIIRALRDHCLGRGVGWVCLVAEPGTEGFYRKLGFRRMRGHSPMRHKG